MTPTIRRGSTLRTTDSNYSANSTKNTALVTGRATEYGGLYTIIKCTRHDPEVDGIMLIILIYRYASRQWRLQ